MICPERFAPKSQKKKRQFCEKRSAEARKNQDCSASDEKDREGVHCVLFSVFGWIDDDEAIRRDAFLTAPASPDHMTTASASATRASSHPVACL